MARDWSFGEVLKAVFPLLDGNDLTSCMLVSRQWRETAKDEYLWKSISAKRWPSICRRPPPNISYQKLYKTFSMPARFNPLLPPQISFEDLVLYIDLWSNEQLIFSEAILGSNLRSGIKNRPQDISEHLTAYLDDSDYRMIMQIEPSFNISFGPGITVSVLASRRDTNKMACLLNRAQFDHFGRYSIMAHAFDCLNFSPAYPYMYGKRAWVLLLYSVVNNDIVDVFGIETNFYVAASDDEVLRLLEMLDWK